MANLGLILFLFLVGLEVDLRYFAQNWKVALSVGTVGMALPFGLGCAIAYGLFHEFHDDTAPIALGTYMLFIGVAMAITVRKNRLPLRASLITLTDICYSSRPFPCFVAS